MGKHKAPKNPFPEMETLFEGMQELLTDEYGQPLPKDHPHYQRVTNLVNQINSSMEPTLSAESEEDIRGTA